MTSLLRGLSVWLVLTGVVQGVQGDPMAVPAHLRRDKYLVLDSRIVDRYVTFTVDDFTLYTMAVIERQN